MVKIELKDYQLNDLVRTLEFAKNKKKEEYEKNKMNVSQYRFEVGLIQDLIATLPVKTYTRKNKIDKDLIEAETILHIL